MGARDAVLRSAVELLEEVGCGGVTIEGVAARSGVAKSTIYRWWKSKAALVMDGYGQAVAERVPGPDTGTAAGDLTRFMAELYQVVDHPMRVKALRGLMAEAQLDPDFEEPFRGWVRDRRAVVERLLDRAVARGELPADLDVAYATDLVFGPFW
jgi:AcrR family transcriptional regulator